MSRFFHYMWLVILALYILSPLDAHPLFIDDLIAAGVLFYLVYRYQMKGQRQGRYAGSAAGQKGRSSAPVEEEGPMTLEKAYQVLEVSPHATLEEITQAYRKKMALAHPDKVSHLGRELQEKAKEITLKLNTAMDMIRKSRGKG